MAEVYEYVRDIRHSLQSINRFFCNEDFLRRLRRIFAEAEQMIPEKSIFFRARIYLEEDRLKPKEPGFLGLNAEESFVNLTTDWPNNGRMNPTGITVLYMASDESTAIREIKPFPDQLYSVAAIKTLKPLKIANLSDRYSMQDDDFDRYLSVYVQEWLSLGSRERDYVFPQFVASYCQHLGYDGIAYRSKYATRAEQNQNKGINYTIFNFAKCKPERSRLYRVEEIAARISEYTEE